MIFNLKKIQNMKKMIYSIVIFAILAPVIVNFMLGSKTPFNIEVVGLPSEWISFYGSYLGGIITALVGFYTIYRSNKQNKLQIQITYKQEYIKNLKLTLANSISLFDCLREDDIADCTDDLSKCRKKLNELCNYRDKIMSVANGLCLAYNGESEKKEAREFQSTYKCCAKMLWNNISQLKASLDNCKGESNDVEIGDVVQKFISIRNTSKGYLESDLYPKAQAWIASEERELETLKSKL